MKQAAVTVNRPWIPVATAVGIGVVMLLLAAGPFESPVTRFGLEIPLIRLLAPPDTVDGFPDRFEWEPVAGSTYYLVGVARVDSGRVDPLFRQPGETNVLELQFDVATAPPAGHYAWEVLAFGADGLPTAKGSGAFVVR